MFNLKNTHNYVEKKQIKKKSDNTPILSDSK